MSTEASNVVQYSGFGPWQHLRVQRLGYEERLADAGPLMRGLVLATYQRTFEVPYGSLPAGTVAQRYGEEHTDAFVQRAVDSHRRGSQYWVIRGGDQLVGLAKVSPGETLDEPQPGVVYINDVIVAPEEQRKGYGSALLHAALKFGGHEPASVVALDAFEAGESRVVNTGFPAPGSNQLYVGMGLERVGPADPFGFPNGAELWMCEYRTPEGTALDGVVKALEERRFALGAGRPQIP
jgi:GNAT superfamily N-acetyltransferase